MIEQDVATRLSKSVCARCRGTKICARCRDLYQLVNAEMLFDYFVDDPSPVPDEVATKVATLVSTNLGITYYQLTNNYGVDPDHLNMLIATNAIYVDLGREIIADTKETHIYFNEESAKSHVVVSRGKSTYLQDHHEIEVDVGKKIRWGKQEWTIAAYDDSHVTLLAENGTVIKPAMAAFQDLVRKGEIVGLNKAPARSSADKEYDDFYRRATKKDWRSLERRRHIIEMLNSQKGGQLHGKQQSKQ